MLRNNKIPKTSGCSSVWLERYLGVVEAVGSSPVTPTRRANLSNDLIRQLRGSSFIHVFLKLHYRKNI